MTAVLRIESFADTFWVVAIVTTALLAGAAFGFWQAIRCVADWEDEKDPGRFVQWFVDYGSTTHRQEWRGWGIGGTAIGAWLGGGVVIVLPLSWAIWALWVS